MISIAIVFPYSLISTIVIKRQLELLPIRYEEKVNAIHSIKRPSYHSRVVVRIFFLKNRQFLHLSFQERSS